MKKLIIFLLISIIYLSNSAPFPVIKDGRLGYIDSDGKLIIPLDFGTEIEYNSIKFNGKEFKNINLPQGAFFNEGYASVIKSDYFWFIQLSKSNVLINQNGDIVLNSSSQKLGKFSCGLVPIAIHNKVIDVYVEYFTYCDINGNILTDYGFEFTGPFYEDLALVKNEKLFYYISKSGLPIGENSYNGADRFSNGMAAVMVDSLWGYINSSGKMVIIPDFDHAGCFNDQLAKVRKGDKFGYINTTGNFIVKPIYQQANDFSSGLASIQSGNGLWGFINSKGETAIEPKFLAAGNYINGLAPVNLDGKFGYINKKGEFIIKPQYSLALDFFDSVAKVWIEDKMYYINLNGDIIWEFDFD